MKLTSTLIILMLVALTSQAEGNDYKVKLENDLLFQHWAGSDVLLEKYKFKNSEFCSAISAIETKHSGAVFLVQRTTQVRARLKCQTNFAFVQDQLKSENPIILSSVVRLASSFTQEQKERISPLISVHKKNTDPLVIEAISAFEK